MIGGGEGVYKNGKLEKLTVTPESRRKDVRIVAGGERDGPRSVKGFVVVEGLVGKQIERQQQRHKHGQTYRRRHAISVKKG